MLVNILTLRLSRITRKAIVKLNRERIKPTLASGKLCKKKFKLPSTIPEKKLVARRMSRIFDSFVCALEKNEKNDFVKHNPKYGFNYIDNLILTEKKFLLLKVRPLNMGVQ